MANIDNIHALESKEASLEEEPTIKRRKLEELKEDRNESSVVKVHIGDLPSNLLYYIFCISTFSKTKHLQQRPQNRLLPLRLVCQLWNQVILAFVERLRFRCAFCPSGSLAFTLSSKFERLRSLALDGYLDLNPELFETQGQIPATSLRTSLLPSSLSSSSEVPALPSKLRSLSFKNVYLNSRTFKAIVNRWSDSLQEIHVSPCPHQRKLGHQAFLHLVNKCGASLRKLNVPFRPEKATEVYGSDLSEPNSFSPLRYLSTLVDTCNQGFLTELIWHKVPHRSPSPFPPTSLKRTIWKLMTVLVKNNPGLKVLRFGGYPSRKCFLGWLGEHCHQLEVCELLEDASNRYFAVVEDDFRKFAKGCPLLKELCLDDRVGMTREALLTLSQFSKELKYLDVLLDSRSLDEARSVIDQFGCSCQENRVTKIQRLKFRSRYFSFLHRTFARSVPYLSCRQNSKRSMVLLQH
jgi:hypothetical protein